MSKVPFLGNKRATEMTNNLTSHQKQYQNLLRYQWNVFVVFNFISGSNFIFLCFKLIIIHYNSQKQKKIKFEPRIKLNHNIFIKPGI